MLDESETSSNAGESGRIARFGRTNNYYYNTQRPRNNVGGLEQLMLITCSRTPVLDLKKVKEALQKNKT